MSDKKYECPYCRYLYDDIYIANGGETGFENSCFDCDNVFQTCDNLYNCLIDKTIIDELRRSENDEFEKIFEEYRHSFEDIYIKLEKIYTPETEDYKNGKYLCFCVKFFIREDKLFLNRTVDPELKEFYDATLKLYNSLAGGSLDMEILFTVMFNMLTIMNSVALTDETSTVRLIVDEPDLDAIEKYYNFKELSRKLCDNSLFMFIPKPSEIIFFTKANRWMKSLNDNDLEDAKQYTKFLRFFTKYCKFSDNFWSRNKHYAAAARELYFFKALSSTYYTAKQAKLWEV